jgi:hypothetical protein
MRKVGNAKGKILGKPQGKRSLAMSRCKLTDKIKTNLMGLGCDDVD